MHTRWGQELVGRFHDTAGEVVALADGKRQVVLSLATSTVEIVDHSRYTRFARGPRFFDAERFPQVVFVSEPYSAELLTTGGEMYGKLRMHGIERRERFVVAPAQCPRPGRDCPIFAKGVVMRANYDLDTWRMQLTAARLLVRGFDVFRLNFRDHGDTHHLNEGLFHSNRIDEVVRAAVALSERYPIRPLVAAGYSLGGNFALRMQPQASFARSERFRPPSAATAAAPRRARGDTPRMR